MSITPERRARIAKIHIAKKELAMMDESYRAMLARVTGHASSADCTDAQLDAVLAEFRRLGFAGEKPKTTLSDKAYVRMIYGLWKDLRPFLRDHSHRALAVFVKRMTDIDRPEWLNPEDGNEVIEALKAWLERERGKAAALRRQKGKART
jgi:phage gp16-like protein